MDITTHGILKIYLTNQILLLEYLIGTVNLSNKYLQRVEVRMALITTETYSPLITGLQSLTKAKIMKIKKSNHTFR